MDKQVLRDISYGVYIVTTKDKNNQQVGCVINTLTQITSKNPIISISINKDNYTNQAIHQTKKLAISILSEKTNKEVIGIFGYHSSKDTDKFANVNYKVQSELPIIQENTCGTIIAEVSNIIDCDTHDIFIARVLELQKENNYSPMTYKYFHEELKGTSPQNAPTYEEPISEKKDTDSAKYRCRLCGYIYDDAKETIKFADLPEDWRCPLCGATKDQFEKITE